MESEPYIDRTVRHVGNITDKHGYRFTVYNGEHRFYLRQVPLLSEQDHIRNFTPGDTTRRFKDIFTIERWLRKEPKDIYYLLDASTHGEVRGIIWHSQHARTYDEHEYPYSFAVRLYEGAQKRGLAKPFMAEALRSLCTTYRDAERGIWLETGEENIDAQGLYTSFGYEEVYRDNGRVHMVLSPERITTIREAEAGD